MLPVNAMRYHHRRRECLPGVDSHRRNDLRRRHLQHRCPPPSRLLSNRSLLSRHRRNAIRSALNHRFREDDAVSSTQPPIPEACRGAGQFRYEKEGRNESGRNRT
jgi:hypothetical protein